MLINAARRLLRGPELPQGMQKYGINGYRNEYVKVRAYRAYRGASKWRFA